MKIAAAASQSGLPELWGGIECTIARVGDSYRDQVRDTGHDDRPEDLDRFAAIGIKKLRYPILWESIAPQRRARCEWSWHDERLERLRELQIAPIAGLVHHGSGPRYTNLLDPAFPDLLASHAERVAARYPWIDMYTPVNEPLTTARFSGLYGHWYPHGRDMGMFLRALITQCRGILSAMKAIRRIRPDAQLVQTEDLGKTFSTPLLSDQAAHENERRWLSFDLICGHIDRSHPWYEIFLRHGIKASELDGFREHPCPPDVMGINHYLTSDRFLDEKLHLYPEASWGGNGHRAYADVEAVRVEKSGREIGMEARLREAFARYRLPIAITEVHNGCTREEQLRWLMDAWTAARRLRSAGADIRAVTLWSLVGAVDWNSLLTREENFYETGIFDARFTPIRPTVLAKAAQSLNATGTFDHPVLDREGWWHRHDRYYLAAAAPLPLRFKRPPRPLLITGATGTLGQAFRRLCVVRGLEHHILSRADMDISSPAKVKDVLQRHRPWAVVNAAGYVRVAEAEYEKDRCMRENVEGAAVLAEACASLGISYVTFSSDLVFNGRSRQPYRESDPPSPRSVYGLSKSQAEQRVQDIYPEAFIVRTSAFFGPWDRYNFAHAVLDRLGSGHIFEAKGNLIVSPTYVPDLVHATLDLLIDGEKGIWHIAGPTALSWYEFALRIARKAGFDESLVLEQRDGPPSSTALVNERGFSLPALDHALDRFFREIEIPSAAPSRRNLTQSG